MYRLLRKPFLALFFLMLSQMSYSLPYPFSFTEVPLFDMAIFQANLGWADFSAPGVTLDVLQRTIAPDNVSFKSSGVHISLNLSDVKRLKSNWFLGGRIGAQIFSNLKDSVYISTPLISNQVTQSYNLQLPGGFFADALVYKTIKKYYAMGFAGIGYDRYMFEGYQNFTTGAPARIRNSRIWAAGARLGGGIGMQFKGNLMAGVEYTHRFNQSITALANSGNYPYETRVHNLNITGNSLDLIFGVALYD